MRKLIYLFLLFNVNIFAQQIDRIEPSFWWSDMTNSNLQILLYGKDIAQLDVKINAGTITSVHKTENPNYIFIDWETKNLANGIYKIQFIKNGKIVSTQNYELKSRKENSHFRNGFDSSDAVYLIMSDRFANGDPNNDTQISTTEKANRNFDGGRHGGDIQGIINNLDYIHELGATALWCTPLLEDNEKVYSYHGYACSDYYKIDPRFGINEDMKTLSSELHKRGMKHIMDYVTNHWGGKHWIIQDLPSKDWIHYWDNQENGFQRSSYRMSTQFDNNASKFDKNACLNGWFDTTMPDMNQQNPLLIKYMIQNAIWWIEFADLDGLRVDTYPYNDQEGISKWTKAILDEYPNFNIVGEVWMHDQSQISYWQKDSPIGKLQSYNSYLPSVMDFTLFETLAKSLNDNNMNWDEGMVRFYENFTNDFLYADPMNIMVFLGNHDTSRINSDLKEDLAKYKLGLTLISTVRGYPQLYYGDEIGMTGLKSEGDGMLRKDFPGGWKDDSQNAFKQTGRTEKQNEYFNFSKKVLNWRKNSKVIHEGKFMHFVPVNNVYVYFRFTEKETVMIILNGNDKKQTLEWNRYTERTKGFTKGTDIISNNEIIIGENIEINAKTSMIIEFKK